MKKYTSWLGVMMVMVAAVCGAAALPARTNSGNTLLTGQVMQKQANKVTLNLGELTALQTPENALSGSLLPGTIRVSAAHPLPEAQSWSEAPKAFVSWQRDTILDLGEAECFILDENGDMKETSPETIAPQDILNVAVGEGNIPVTVFVLSGVSKSDADTTTLQGTAAALIEENTHKTGGEYESAATDENALRITSADVSLRNVRVNKSEGDGSDVAAGDRYGMNAALLATGGARLTFTKGVVDSAAVGGSGIFGHGSGTTVQLRDGTVTTTGNYAEGIQVTGGADMQARNMTVITAGDTSAVLRAENASLEANGGTYTSGGYHSPALFAAGTVRLRNAQLTANNSEAIVLKGPYTVSLENCNLSGNMAADLAQETTHTVLICGGSGQGTSSFAMTGGSLTSQNGAVFCATDTDCEITLERVDITNTGGNTLLRAEGTSDSAGAVVSLTACGQTLEGNLVVDNYSTLHLNLHDSSLLCGAVLPAANGEPAGSTSVHIDRGCTWSLTADSTVDTLENEGTVQYNGYSITLSDGTVLTA